MLGKEDESKECSVPVVSVIFAGILNKNGSWTSLVKISMLEHYSIGKGGSGLNVISVSVGASYSQGLISGHAIAYV